MIKGEVLLVVDGKVQDSSVFNNVTQKLDALRTFLQVKFVIQHEHPESVVSIETRETLE